MTDCQISEPNFPSLNLSWGTSINEKIIQLLTRHKIFSRIYMYFRYTHNILYGDFVFRPIGSTTYGKTEMPIYRQEVSKMSEDEVIRLLQDFKK